MQLSGSLKKSLSVIDGTSYQINTIWHKIYTDLKSLKEGNEVLKKKQAKNHMFFKKELAQVEQYLMDIFKNTKKNSKIVLLLLQASIMMTKRQEKHGVMMQ